MMGNKLIGQSLANKKQKRLTGIVYMQLYACVVLLIHRNTFIRFGTAFVSICKHT